MALTSLLLLAEASHTAPNWTDKEVLIAVGSVVGAMIPIVLFVIKFCLRAAECRARRLVEENKNLREKLSSTEPAPAKVEPGEIEMKLRVALDEVERLGTLDAKNTDNAATSRGLIEQHKQHLASLQQDLEQHRAELEAERRRIKKALRKDGQTWNEKVLANTPEFKPLDPDGRRTPILSVLNLKGGVGKTTVTANLAAALDGLGYRVLLLDLDLQGSLTGFFLPEARHAELFGQEMLLEDFLASSFGAEFPNLLDYTQPILTPGQSALVPTSDYLAYAETNLTIRWLLREGNRDVRFLLRKELHLKRVTKEYDVVLLDCPPLINVCCVNALAASDYLVVPVMPSRQATARVPVLLGRLKEFRENINPDLKVLGVVANRTSRSELTIEEQNKLSLLRDQCKDVWGEQVTLLDTFIRQSAEVRAAEDAKRTLGSDDEMYQAFVALAREVASRLPTFCRATTAPRGVLS
jgi:cellulose biosynthesis protein BcsQ